MKRSFKALTALILCAVTLFSSLDMLSFPTAAADSTEEKSLELDIFKKGSVKKQKGIMNMVNGSDSLNIHTEPNATALSFVCEFDVPSLLEFSQLALTLEASSDTKNLPASITLLTEEGAYPQSFTLKNTRQTVYIKLSQSIADDITGISFSFSEKGAIPDSLSLISCVADTYLSYAYSAVFGADRIIPDCKYEKTETDIALYPEGNACSVAFSLTENYDKSTSLTVVFNVSNIISGSAFVTSVYDDGQKTDSPLQSINSDGSYAFLLKGGFSQLILNFKELSLKGSSFSLTGAHTQKLFTSAESLGSVISCKMTDGNIRLEGSLSSSAAVEYYGARLYLFAIPISEIDNYYLKSYSPIAKSSFSTRFTLSAPFDETYPLYQYVAVLSHKGELIPISDPVAPSTSSPPVTASASVTALYKCDDTDVFSVGVSSTVVDVFAEQLMADETSYSAPYRKFGKIFRFNSSLLSELDQKMLFYSACSVKPYLKLSLEGLSVMEKDGSFNEDVLSYICALLSHLSEKYPYAAGFIIGGGLNEDENSANAKNIKTQALLLSVFGECIKSKNPYAQVFITLKNSQSPDPYLHLFSLSSYMSHYSGCTFGILLEADDYSTQTKNTRAKLGAISTMLSLSSDGTAILWNVPPELTPKAITDTYRLMCVESASQGLRFCALSPEAVSAEEKPQLFEQLKKALDEENVIPTSHSSYKAESVPPTVLGSYSLWDFTSSYHTGGWVSGGAFSTPETSKDENGRFLLSRLETGKKTEGVLVGRIEGTADMSGLWAAVTLNIKGEGESAPYIEIIFASGGERAVYTSTVQANTKSTLYCDLSQFSGSHKIDYAAIVLRGNTASELQLSKIELCSQNEKSEELVKRFKAEPPEESSPMLYASLILAAALTVAVFSLLMRKQQGKEPGENDKK